MAEKTKQVKEHTRRLKNGKVVKVRAHSARYKSAEDDAKEATKKKGAGKEFESMSIEQKVAEMTDILSKKLFKDGYEEYDSPRGKFYFKGDTATGKGRYAMIGGRRAATMRIERGSRDIDSSSLKMFKDVVTGKRDEYVRKTTAYAHQQRMKNKKD